MKFSVEVILRTFLSFFLIFLSFNVLAHKPSDSYLTLAIKDNLIEGQWDIALRDLDFVIGLDANGDGKIEWGEVRSKHAEINAYALSHLQLSIQGGVCPAKVTDNLIDNHTDGAYAVMRFTATCAHIIEVLQSRYSLLFEVDPQHKGLLQLQYKGASSTAIFSPEKSIQQFTINRPNKLRQFSDYAVEGIWHIWIGFDHILFLLALLLPAVVLRENDKWQPVKAFKPALWAVLKIVTAFTLAHSITLSLATLRVLTLPSRFVESIIAASVIVAALNNIYPFFREKRWAMAFVFGLIHGFGFATVLSDLGLPKEALAVALVGFNIGVEAGQLAIVTAFLPIAFLLRATNFYRNFVLLGGSAGIATLATIWFCERALNFKVLPF